MRPQVLIEMILAIELARTLAAFEAPLCCVDGHVATQDALRLESHIAYQALQINKKNS